MHEPQLRLSLSLSLGLVGQLVNLHNFDMFFFFLCMYILAVWHDPGGLRGCFVSGWSWEKEAHSFHSCTAPMEAPAPAPPDPKPPPSSAFINTSHYSSSSLHRNVKEGCFPGQQTTATSNTHVLFFVQDAVFSLAACAFRKSRVRKCIWIIMSLCCYLTLK